MELIPSLAIATVPPPPPTFCFFRYISLLESGSPLEPPTPFVLPPVQSLPLRILSAFVIATVFPSLSLASSLQTPRRPPAGSHSNPRDKSHHFRFEFFSMVTVDCSYHYESIQFFDPSLWTPFVSSELFIFTLSRSFKFCFLFYFLYFEFIYFSFPHQF